MASKSQTQRALLSGFIGSVALCGVIGICCLLIGRFGPLASRVLGTTAAIGGASILGLAAAIPWERRRWFPIGPAGMFAVVVALALLLCLIWIDQFWQHDGWIKAMAVACTLAVALPHAGLLSLARLRRDYEWARWVTLAAIGALAVLISAMVILEHDDDLAFRVMGAIAILDVCGTITVPILHRLSAIREHDAVASAPLEIHLTCPRCRKAHTLPVGRSRCPSCGLQLRIEIEEEHCRHCGYVLYGNRSGTCPECGSTVDSGAAQAAPEPTPRAQGDGGRA